MNPRALKLGLCMGSIAVLLLLAGILAVNRSRPPDDVRWDGLSLSAWLAESDAMNPGGERARVALKKIGTNALPYLLRTLVMTNSPPPPRVRALMEEYAPILVPVRLPAAHVQRARALVGFEALGPSASNAVPQLRTLLRSGPPSLRPLAIQALGSIRQGAVAAIPDLLNALGQVPVLPPKPALTGTQRPKSGVNLEMESIAALERIVILEPRASGARPYRGVEDKITVTVGRTELESLVPALSNASVRVESSAVALRVLDRIFDRSDGAQETLVSWAEKIINDPWLQTYLVAPRFGRRLREPAFRNEAFLKYYQARIPARAGETPVQAFGRVSRSPSSPSQQLALRALIRFGPDEPAVALPILIDFIRPEAPGNSGRRQSGAADASVPMDGLRRLGAAARPAVPVLLEWVGRPVNDNRPWSALLALTEIDLDSARKAAVPMISNLLTNQKFFLAGGGPEAERILPRLVKLESPGPIRPAGGRRGQLLWVAANILGSAGTNGAAAFPALLQYWESDSHEGLPFSFGEPSDSPDSAEAKWLQRQIGEALKKMDPAAAKEAGIP